MVKLFSANHLGLPGGDFFWELATLIDILLLGHWLEMKSVLDASKALNLLVGVMPEEAHLVTETGTEDIPLKNLRRGDVILVKPGEEVPADGVIIEGEGYLNEAMLTGESKPVKKTTGDQAIGGSINGNSSLKLRVKHIGEDSYLAKFITRM
ncbi:MAG: HAD-IC family P-type ATPase [Bacteroidota bacterium]